MNTQIIISHDDLTVLIAQTGQGASGEHRQVGPFPDLLQAWEWTARMLQRMVKGDSPFKVSKPRNVNSSLSSKYEPVDAPKREVSKGTIRAGGRTPTTPPPK